MTDLHFAQPLWLWALAVLPFFAVLLFSAERRRRETLDRLIKARKPWAVAMPLNPILARALFSVPSLSDLPG